MDARHFIPDEFSNFISFLYFSLHQRCVVCGVWRGGRGDFLIDIFLLLTKYGGRSRETLKNKRNKGTTSQ